MKFVLTGTEKWNIWKPPHATYWCVAPGRDGCPFGAAKRFATWREAMAYVTGTS